MTALDDISIYIPRGQLLCLLGRSGHGKSTLLRSIAGLSQLTSGKIEVNEKRILKPDKDMCMVFQEDTIFPWMKVKENVMFGLTCRGIEKKEAEKKAKDWLSLVGLNANINSWPKELSGGMKKRVAIAAAFSTGSEVLLMDEPFGSLDYVTRLNLQNQLLSLLTDIQRTVVFVTHDIEEALYLADRIVVIENGRIVDDLELSQRKPRDDEYMRSDHAFNLRKRIKHYLGIEEIHQSSVASLA